MLVRALSPLHVPGRPARPFSAARSSLREDALGQQPSADRSAAFIDMFERASTPMGTLQRAEAALAAAEALASRSNYPAPKAPAKTTSASAKSTSQPRCAALLTQRAAVSAQPALLRFPETGF